MPQKKPDWFRVAAILGGGLLLVYFVVKVGPSLWFLP